jgi:hypothetical protein
MMQTRDRNVWKRSQLLTLVVAFLLTGIGTTSLRASVVEFSGHGLTTAADTQVFFSPITGAVSASFFDTALFGVGNVAGNQATAFNLAPDGSFVVSPDASSFYSVARIGSATAIGPNDSFGNSELTLAESGSGFGNWNDFGNGYIGLMFTSGSDLHYGWANITVDSDYNVALNSFAYETVAGAAIVTPTSVPEPSSLLLMGLASLGVVLFRARNRYRGKFGVLSAVALVPMLMTGRAGAQTVAVPGQTDPAAGRLMQFRSDQLFTMGVSTVGTTNLSTYTTTVTNSPFGVAAQSSSQSTTTPYAGSRQYKAASGRFLTPEHDDVVLINGDVNIVDVTVVGHPELGTIQLPGMISRYVQTVTGGTQYPSADWISVAVGDLDGNVDTSGNYHDEVAVAYVTTGGVYEVAVLDFSNSVINPSTNQLQTQQPTVTLFAGMNGALYNPSIMVGESLAGNPDTLVLPDDNLISVAIGSFDGGTDGTIALAAVLNGSSEAVQTLRYRPEIQTILPINIQSLAPPPIIPETNVSLAAKAMANVDLAVGDFEGSGSSDLAFGSTQYFGSVDLPQMFMQSSVSILKSSLQPATVAINVYAGNPTYLTLAQIGFAGIPKQLTISGAPAPWTRLNGTWPTTIVNTPQGGTLGIELPIDSSDITSSGPTPLSVTMSLSTGLAATANNPVLRWPSNAAYSVPFNNPYNYQRMRLVSGLFQYDPANGFDFSRRQLAMVSSEDLGTLSATWYSVTDDATGNPLATQLGTYTLQAPASGASSQHNFDATAGAFRGNSLLLNPDSTANGTATWPIMINAWYNNGQQTLCAIDAGATGTGVTLVSNSVQPYDSQERFALVNYDADGNSVYLGAPVHMTTTAFNTPTLILQEPPKHAAWLNPTNQGSEIVNVSRNDGFNVQFQSMQQEALTGSTNLQSSSTTTSLTTISAGLSLNLQFPFGFGSQTSIQDTYKLGSNLQNTSAYYGLSSQKISYDTVAATVHDDYVRAQTQNLDVWRYRVYGAEVNPASGYLYFDMAYPTAPQDIGGAGLGLEWYNPIYENGNLLSYPPLPSTGSTPDDVGASYTVNGQMPAGLSNGLLYSGNSFAIGGASGAVKITLANMTSDTDTLGWTKTNSWDNNLKISETLKLNALNANASFDADYGQKQSLSATTSTNDTLSGSTSITLNAAGGNGDQTYSITPVLYNSNAGILKFIDYVAIPTDPVVTTFWTDNYGGEPDPAFNLPHRFAWASFNQSSNTTTWNLESTIDRETLRGFYVTSATENPIESTPNNPVFDPVSINPTAGATVRLAVQVFNYSINTATQPVTVSFWSVPYNSVSDDETACNPAPKPNGQYCSPVVRTPLGTTQISSIPAWGSGQNWTVAALNWTIPTTYSGDYRIYVTLSTTGATLNPPQQPCNDSPASAPTPCTGMITSSTSPGYDPNAPGQNKEGFGYITIQAPIAQATSLQAPQASGAPRYTKVHATSDSLTALGPDQKLKTNFVTAYLGRPLRLRMKAVSDGNNDATIRKTVVYDGMGKNRSLIAGRILRGVSTSGSHSWFQWTPSSLGLHQLTAQILGSAKEVDQWNNSAKLWVIVVRLPGDVNGDGIIDGFDTATILREGGKRVSESSCGSACDLNGDGWITRADFDLAVMRCDHDYCVATPRSKARRAPARRPDSGAHPRIASTPMERASN